MRTLTALHIIGLVGCCGAIACSSSKKEEGDDPNSGYHVGGAGSVPQNAQDTVNGTVPISADTAASLNTNKCQQGKESPKGSGPPILEFVIDASGSMGEDPANPADPNSPSKWEVFTQSIPSVFGALPAEFAVGVSFYNKSRSTCPFALNQAVPIAPLTPAQQATISDRITRTQPNGYTPTYNAWLGGVEAVTSWQRPAGYESSPEYVVLITDGVPTVQKDGCTTQSPISQNEYDGQIKLIRDQTVALAAQGTPVKTFVVGVVGSENPQDAAYDPLYMLSQIAEAGGTAAPAGCVSKSGTPAGDTVNPRGTYCHFDLSQAADFATALSQSIGTIAQSVISCDYAVPPPPSGQQIDPDQVVLEFNDGAGNYSLILKNTSDTCDKGWQFANANNNQIHICGSTCDLIQNNPNAELTLIFGCTTGQIIN